MINNVMSLQRTSWLHWTISWLSCPFWSYVGSGVISDGTCGTINSLWDFNGGMVYTVLNSLYPKIINVSKIDFVNILARLLLALAIHYDSIIPCGCTVKVSLVPSWFPQLIDCEGVGCPQNQSRTGVVLTETHLLTRTGGGVRGDYHMIPLHSMLRGEGGGPLEGDHWRETTGGRPLDLQGGAEENRGWRRWMEGLEVIQCNHFLWSN